MNNTETGEILRADSLRIANDFFKVLNTAFSMEPIYITDNCCSIKFREVDNLPQFLADKILEENKLTTVVSFRELDEDGTFEIIQEKVEKNTTLNRIYRVVTKGRIFEFSIWDSEDDFGYCSMCPDYNPETYVFCNIMEKRNDERVKYEMDFAFDLEKKTFLELFAIEHRNKKGLLRECKEINAVEKELRDTVIFTNFN